MQVLNLLATSLFIFSSLAAADNFEFSETADDFSNSSKLLLSIDSESNRARLLLHCVEGQDLQIQFHSDTKVIFPDRADSDHARMFINVLHKFDGADKAIRSEWIMSMMEYYDAWYLGDQKEFLEQLLASEIFAAKLLKNNDSFRFKLGKAKPAFEQLRSTCASL
jgi:hypothetical protein